MINMLLLIVLNYGKKLKIKQMKKVLFCLSVLSIIISGYAQQPIPKIGETININTKNWINFNKIPIDYNKIIIIDFWATWCGPCIAAFPELDKIQKKYANKIQIIALSDEPKETVENFFKTKKLNFNFSIDSSKKTYDFFNIEGRPTTIIIDQNKKFIWAGGSEELDSIITVFLLTGKLSSDTTNKDNLFRKYYTLPSELQINKQYPFYYYINISNKSDNFFKKISYKPPFEITYKSTPVSTIIKELSRTPSLRFINKRIDLDTTLIDIEAKSTTFSINLDKISDIALQNVKSIFNFDINIENKKVQVLYLEIPDTSKIVKCKNKIEGGGIIATKDHQITIIRLSISDFTQYLENQCKKIIIPSFNSDNKFDFILDKYKDFESFKKQLVDKYGIVLREGTADIDFTIVQ